MKKILNSILCMIVLIAVMTVTIAVPVFGEDGKEMSISLRIEGIEENIYYKTVEIPYSEKLTLKDAIAYVDEIEDDLTVIGLDSNYITDINGESAGKFGGWDGWLYKVNDEELAVGIDECELSEGDSILLYFGDPYGKGMQFPKSDISKINDGIIKFTSEDTTYDSEFNPVVSVNPVVGMTVTWNYGDKSAVYTTDENGEIKIDEAQLTAGTHEISVEKKDESGLPLVLRLAPGYTVNIDEVSDIEKPGIEEPGEDADNTFTGDNGTLAYIAAAFLAAGMLVCILGIKNRKNYEK